jgi:hypothetical protein
MTDRLRAIYERVTSWQRRTFPHQTAAGLLAHMRLELKEIEAAPHDIEERADMAILAMALVDRSGRGFSVPPFGLCWGSSTNHIALEVIRERLNACERGGAIDLPVFICECSLGTHLSEAGFLSAISAKMDRNEGRRWPTPDQQVPGQPVEHIRELTWDSLLEPTDVDKIGEELQFDAVIAALTPAPDIVGQHGELVRIRSVLGATGEETALQVAERIAAERAEWRADNERLRTERREIRAWLQAKPNEGAMEAVRRLSREVPSLRTREGGR